MNNKNILIVAAVIIVLLFLAGLALAGAVNDRQFTACLSPFGFIYNAASGTEPARPCRFSSTQISWNADALPGEPGTTGLDGEDGANCWELDGALEDINADGMVDVLDCQNSAPGPEGPQGDPGAAYGAIVEENSLQQTTGPQESATALLLCSPGKQPLRSAYTVDASPEGCVDIQGDHPYFDQLNQRGWELRYTASCAADVHIELNLLCLESDFQSHPIPKKVFASSRTYTGNLGGIAGADSECQDMAEQAGLPGQFRAWLGLNDYGPVSWDVHVGTVFEDTADPANRIANSWRDLRDGDLLHPLNTNEFGLPVTGPSTKAWTAVDPSGQPNHQECESWLTDIPFESPAGSLLHTDKQWTLGLTHTNCSTQHHIYCFEQ